MESLWQKTAELPRFGALNQDLKTDVLIIGGGIAGLLCAYSLKQAGVNCVLVEARRLCSGITKNTTAKITVQHGLIYDKLIRTFGLTAAKLYLQANRSALEQYAELCRTIDCDFQWRNSYVYSVDNVKKLERELTALDKIGCGADFAEKLPLPFPVAGAVWIEHQAQFNPLKFLSAISKNLSIYENSEVLELRPDGAVTAHGVVSAEKIIVATHFPFLNKHGSYYLKLYQHRSYVLGLKNGPDVNGMYLDEDKKGLSFRNAEGFLLLGGGSHRTGKKGGGWQELEDFSQRCYPDSPVAYRWATQDCMSLDGIPYIGRYSAKTPNLYVATGFNKWGMTSAMAAASIITDLVLDRDNPYTDLFSPSRSILRPQLAVNSLEAVANLMTPTAPRCPHLGCALKYNPAEHSWDCPCHGSRFTSDGKLIDNPSTGNIKV